MKILVDSDILVGAFRKDDTNNFKAISLLKLILSNHQGYIINLVLMESATVLSHRIGMDAVKLFLKRFPELELTIIDMDHNLEEKAWEIFTKQTKKGCSYVDCANLASIAHYHLDKIASFDGFYPKHLVFLDGN
ncbi:hypothetical protein A3D77_00945 [Candidatus Gottesmanbacteria bacterium RIFCSPHIGHO2_02_FULL_39_11]|uniref:PIN domain-containing protein n=1 Tax=Candidatus Gottesmanbacteria bacterium RIFCSPHIGHO2_02_FULL_39_11 TaxID=1798382 RepID=A0A1F5ZNK0_9BACT|nr:MAG: hypothetical protein A3D77_00945 [Candidatus Gottesmanbacteria bacterium RIFCSPHIGHO2_02_FULL_39_11]